MLISATYWETCKIDQKREDNPSPTEVLGIIVFAETVKDLMTNYPTPESIEFSEIRNKLNSLINKFTVKESKR